MAYAAAPSAHGGDMANDDLDRLLDMDNTVDDLLNELGVPSGDRGTTRAPEAAPRDEDQEVQVKRKRNLVPKLDENRLLSNAGIPRLRKITKSKLKFRGKGYEFSDISNLLNTYQLWLDDLYPRAKFRDALSMVEKVGHSKRMQVTRRAWLDDTKPNRQGLDPDAQMSGVNENGDTGGQREQSPMFGDNGGDAPAEDELNALMTENQTDTAMRVPNTHKDQTNGFDDGPDEDELDGLLAESAPRASAQPARTQGPFGEDSDDDDLDALMAEQETTAKSNSIAHVPKPQVDDHGDDNDFADEEEAMANMGW